MWLWGQAAAAAAAVQKCMKHLHDDHPVISNAFNPLMIQRTTRRACVRDPWRHSHHAKHRPHRRHAHSAEGTSCPQCRRHILPTVQKAHPAHSARHAHSAKGTHPLPTVQGTPTVQKAHILPTVQGTPTVQKAHILLTGGRQRGRPLRRGLRGGAPPLSLLLLLLLLLLLPRLRRLAREMCWSVQRRARRKRRLGLLLGVWRGRAFKFPRRGAPRERAVGTGPGGAARAAQHVHSPQQMWGMGAYEKLEACLTWELAPPLERKRCTGSTCAKQVGRQVQQGWVRVQLAPVQGAVRTT